MAEVATNAFFAFTACLPMFGRWVIPPSNARDATCKVLHKRKDRFCCKTYREYHLLDREGPVENRRVPPQQLLRTRGNRPRGTMWLAPGAINSACCSSCSDCKKSDERGKFPCTSASSICAKPCMTVDRELLWEVLERFRVRPRCLQFSASSMTACGLACVRTMVSTQNGLTSSSGFASARLRAIAVTVQHALRRCVTRCPRSLQRG